MPTFMSRHYGIYWRQNKFGHCPHRADHMAKKIDVKQINQSVMSASIEKNWFWSKYVS